MKSQPHCSLATTVLFVAVILSVAQQNIYSQTISLNLVGGTSIPQERLKDAYSMGWSGEVSAEIHIAGVASFVLGTGYSDWPVKSGLGGRFLKENNLPGSLDITGSIRNIPLSFGIRYYSTGQLFDFFVGLTTNRNFLKGTAEARYDKQDGTAIVTSSANESWDAQGYDVQIGALYKLQENTAVQFITAYSYITDLNPNALPSSHGTTTLVAPSTVRILRFALGFRRTFEF